MNPNPSSPLKLLQALTVCFMALNIVAVLFAAFEILQGRDVPITITGQTFQHPSSQIYGLMLGLVVAVQGLAWLFFSFLRRVVQGQIFTAQNVRDLRLIALAGFVWWSLSQLLGWGQSQPQTHTVQLGLSSSTFFTAKFLVPLLLMTFAEVMREGLRLREQERRLREEQELTI